MLSDIFDKRYKLSDKRMEVCKACEHYDKKWKKCGQCGCFMEFKSLLPSAKCPLDKWKNINIDSEKEQIDGSK